MKIQASAPSNIAVIKYMGKINTESNVPTNSSLSYTLNSLRTFVEITESKSGKDEWQVLTGPGLLPFEMSEKGTLRFLNHFEFLKTAWGIEGFFALKSASNFPSDCGLASSASSFAALTLATSRLGEHTGREVPDIFELASYARKGSGSSCRSLFGPWVLWGPSGVRPLEFPAFGDLDHVVVVVESGKKAVSSSEAHTRVLTSPLFVNRPTRAEARLANLIAAFRDSDWKSAFELVWSEFQDMHSLFETAQPTFGYFEPGTHVVLEKLRSLWDETDDGPLVTMDAGANVHLMFRPDQSALRESLVGLWSKDYRCLSSSSTGLQG